MIVLTDSNKKLQLVLGGAITTNALEWSVTYEELYASDEIRTVTVTGTSNNTTDVDVVTAPDENIIKMKNIKRVTVYNADTVVADVFLKIDDGGTETILKKETSLAVGGTLYWPPYVSLYS